MARPSIGRTLLSGAAAALDRAATRAAYASGARKSRAEALSHRQRMEALAALERRYAELSTEPFFRPFRDAIAPLGVRVRRLPDGGEVHDLRWASEHEVLVPEIAQRYLRHAHNHHAAARLWLHPEPRPALVLIHGYLAGRHAVEEGIWPSTWLYRLGLDLAFFVLPFHGVRAAPGRLRAPPFPSSDPRVTNEGFRQAIGDLGDLIGWLRSRGSAPVGVMGMSLGGYTAALAATVDHRLRFAIPVIPLSSVADFARDQGRLGKHPEERAREHAALEAIHRWVSPLHRPSVLPDRSMLVIGAEADCITPLHHAQRLAAHFGAPLEAWPGGHLLQLGRAEAFRQVGRFLNRLGVIEDRRR